MLLRRQHRQGDRTGPEPDTAPPPSGTEPETHDAPSDTKPTGRTARKRAKE